MSLASRELKYRRRTGERSAANELSGFFALMTACPPALLKGRRAAVQLDLLKAFERMLPKRWEAVDMLNLL